MKPHLHYLTRGSNHAACIRDAAVENYRIQAGNCYSPSLFQKVADQTVW